MSDADGPVKRSGESKELSHDPRRLKRRRYIAGLSQVAAARAAGCTKSNLSKLEHGAHSASPELLTALASVYGCDITALMPPEDTEDEPEPDETETGEKAA